MTHQDGQLTDAIRDTIRAEAAQLGLDPESVTSPVPSVIIGRTQAGRLVRLDVSSYAPAELTR